jgi:integrase
LRHTFAVRTLVRWCEAGTDVDKKILALTTYLGHVNVTSTYWYFSAVPELMAITGRRFEAFARREGAP